MCVRGACVCVCVRVSVCISLFVSVCSCLLSRVSQSQDLYGVDGVDRVDGSYD